ncbi:serine/threonine protein kinase, partial [Candidatus Frankia alpina]
GPPHGATEMPATAMHSPSFGADTGYGAPPYRGEAGGYGDETAYGGRGYRAGERGDNRDPGEAWQGRAARRRSGPAARQAVPLPLPVLIILLILTVAVTAFVTNELFSSKGSESNSAATPPAVVYANTLGDEIVIGNAGSALSDAGGEYS